MNVVIDSYSESNQSSNLKLDYSNNIVRYGQTFTAHIGCSATSAKFYLKRTGNPTGDITCGLYGIKYTYGSDAIFDYQKEYAISNVVNASTIGTNYKLIEFVFPIPYTLTQEEKYAVHVNYTGNAADYITVGGDNTFSGHDGNYYWSDQYGTVGYESDLIFYVYGELSSNTPSIGTKYALPAFKQA